MNLNQILLLCLTRCNRLSCFISSLFDREVVRWLKGWDPAVFGTAAPEQLAREACGVGSRFCPQQQQGQRQFGSGGGSSDPLGRPEHKVILIAGPPGGLQSRGWGVAGCCPAARGLQGDSSRSSWQSPLGGAVHIWRVEQPTGPPSLAGLGKTTLAHVCAAHCGYRPLEINASDDRGGASLQARILDAVEMQASWHGGCSLDRCYGTGLARCSGEVGTVRRHRPAQG